MAKAKKIPLNEALAEITAAAKPASPALSSTDKAHLIRLKKRGFTDTELIDLAAKAGLRVTSEMLVIKVRKPKEQKSEPAQAAATQSRYASAAKEEPMPQGGFVQRALNAVTK